MLFNSYIFILFFLPLTLLLYFGLNHLGKNYLAKISLIVMSLWFYAYFNIKYFPIIILSIVFNFMLQCLFLKMDEKSALRKMILLVGMILNIGILFYYKYYAFFTENINVVFKTEFIAERLILPLGISFFTFQQVSYLIDCYRGETSRYSLVDYSLFVLFFPQLIAGPIVLHSEMIPQFQEKGNHRFNLNNFYKGIIAFSIGLSKKVLLADVFGNAVNIAYANIEILDTTNVLVIMLAYTLQIYFDFSGYCDMAIGLGYMFNIKLPLNFDSPYKSCSISEFWGRWHITLMRFFRTYLYIPLGGSKKGKARTYFNIFIIFLVSGIWHGANWTFILFGILHGIGAMINRAGRNVGKKIPLFFKWLFTFSYINLLFIMFRANSMEQCMYLYHKILEFKFGAISPDIVSAFKIPEIMFAFEKVGAHFLMNMDTIPYLILILFFLLSMCLIMLAKNTGEIVGDEFKPSVLQAMISMVLLTWSLVSLTGVSTFLYFNF